VNRCWVSFLDYINVCDGRGVADRRNGDFNNVTMGKMRYRRAMVRGGCYAFTVVTQKRQRIFRDSNVVQIFYSAVEKVRARHPFEVEAFVILPDHLHTVWTLPETDEEFPKRWRLIKDAFTRSYLKSHRAPPISPSCRAKGEQGIWQRRYWEHLIRDDADFYNHLDYIHLNPVIHGLATAPRDWPHSSFAKWMERGVYPPEWGSGLPAAMPSWAKAFELPNAGDRLESVGFRASTQPTPASKMETT
jgi:putative transposase